MPRSCRANGDNHSDGEMRTRLGRVTAVATATATALYGAVAEGLRGCLWVVCTSGLTDGHGVAVLQSWPAIPHTSQRDIGDRPAACSDISVDQHPCPHHRLRREA
jgi:hypothetical protein